MLKFRVPQPPEFRCNIRASFATAFKNWRRKSKVPLKKIAADLGLSVAIINKWERGERFPTGPHFDKLAEYTGQPPCRLLCIMAEHCRPADCMLQKKKLP